MTTCCKAMLPDDLIAAHRRRALTPDHPVIRGTAQNPDTFFQAREACTPFYERCPGIVQDAMDEFDVRTGRRYRLFEYHGDPDAERVIVVMGSAAETAHETVDWLRARGERVGVLKVRLYRPFSAAALRWRRCRRRRGRSRCSIARRSRARSASRSTWTCVTALARSAAQADRARADRSSAAATACRPRSSRRRWSKACSTSCRRPSPRNHFTVGIVDDVSHSSLEWDRDLDIEPDDRVAERLLRPGRGRHGRRQQELDQDHRRATRRATPRATSSTTRRSRARSRSRTCVSARRRSGRRI